MSSKLFSYLVSISCCGPVNQPTPTFPNINLTKTMINSLVVWKMTEKGCNNLYFRSFTFNMTYNDVNFQREVAATMYKKVEYEEEIDDLVETSLW